MFRVLRWVVTSRRHPSAVLLATQIAAMLLYPLVERTGMGRSALAVVGISVLIVTTRLVRHTPFLTWISVGIALPAIVLLLLQGYADMPWLAPWSAGLEAIFYFYAAGSCIAYMSADWRATTDELFAAAGTFTLLAWGFTYVYLMLQALQPGSFGAAVNPGAERTWTELMYLSFALLSSTGIGDVIPLTPLARGVASVEMFAGVMYLAVVVSRLIAMTVVRAPQSRDRAS
jgi:uncharacterized membrane protein